MFSRNRCELHSQVDRVKLSTFESFEAFPWFTVWLPYLVIDREISPYILGISSNPLSIWFHHVFLVRLIMCVLGC